MQIKGIPIYNYVTLTFIDATCPKQASYQTSM